jgi:hypothetical protein
MWTDKLFWFNQPGLLLNNYDHYFFWLFAGSTVLGVILKLLSRFTRHPVWSRLWDKFGGVGLSMGISGLIWFGIRYENVPIFADRYWAGLVVLILLIWLVFVFKYMITRFRTEKIEYDRQQVNSRYIPGARR